MLTKPKNLRDEGFTIIEVLIVLAIAGLIMLIVFLAVPALQRNSRNTQRKSDVSAILAAYTEYVNNNNGDTPSTGSCNGTVNGTGSTAGCFLTNAKLAFYKQPDFVFYQTNPPSTPSVSDQAKSVYIVSGYQCKGNNPDNTTATSRNVIALYWVESGGGTPQPQCQESGS